MVQTEYIGKTFGRLKVLEFDHKTVKHQTFFKCVCSCGNPSIKIIRGGDLQSGKTHSCNHCQEFELIGKTFGKLTVLEFSHRDKKYNPYFLCKCSCGNPEKIVQGSNLLSGGVASCRYCMNFELIEKTFGKLKVLSFHHRNKWSQSCFLCACSCGEYTPVVSGSSLKSGTTTQCKSCANKLITRIGKNEHRLLKLKAKELNIKIEHQVSFGNYVVDGYCKETNTIFEVYEKYHDKTIEQDLKRQQDLEQMLACNFVIIPDRSH